VLILLVDDEPDAAFLLERALQRQRADSLLEVCEDVESALHRLAQAPLPALVLTDLRMPDGDGLELLGAIRRDPATAHLPVVVWSGADDPDAAQEADRLGAAWFVVKPTDIEDLDAFLKRLIQLPGVSWDAQLNGAFFLNFARTLVVGAGARGLSRGWSGGQAVGGASAEPFAQVALTSRLRGSDRLTVSLRHSAPIPKLGQRQEATVGIAVTIAHVVRGALPTPR